MAKYSAANTQNEEMIGIHPGRSSPIAFSDCRHRKVKALRGGLVSRYSAVPAPCTSGVSPILSNVSLPKLRRRSQPSFIGPKHMM